MTIHNASTLRQSRNFKLYIICIIEFNLYARPNYQLKKHEPRYSIGAKRHKNSSAW